MNKDKQKNNSDINSKKNKNKTIKNSAYIEFARSLIENISKS